MPALRRVVYAMRIYLAGIESLYKENYQLFDERFVLTSFYSFNRTAQSIVEKSKDYLLDSGAYTFMMGRGGKNPNWDEYIERYADFIVRNNIKKYFELDIDSVVGYEKVKKIRATLEKKTARPCIPVWHLSRGMDEYKWMCDEYGYVAIGGIVSGEITKDKYKHFPALIQEAHKRGAKVHGLGFTDTKKLNIYHFDSVDSTSWGWGRFGYRFIFTGKDMKMIHKPEEKRCVKRAELQAVNIKEWIKFQKWAMGHL